ncbi:MAG: strawberry notch C-terminal domain-containing protein [Bacteroidetes bacterium]|nr:strawberry notch C-terminal domain-containing protein [Bacteroidota bacterium]
MNKEGFVKAVEGLLQSKGRQNKLLLEKMARSFGIHDKNLVKEFSELAIVRQARMLAHQHNKTIAEKYADIVELYRAQVNLSHRTSQSIMLQQYSTPAPIGYLMGIFCGVDKAGDYFEPSAGNGLLTIAGDPQHFYVNEIDAVRRENLKTQNFKKVHHFDATSRLEGFRFDAVLTNPPFGRLRNDIEIEGYAIKDLDHLMAIRALDSLNDSGRAAIIIGNHTQWDVHGRIAQGKNRIFFNYLHKHYHVLDTIQIDGHALYSRQGTSFNVRLILIDGRKPTPEGVAPLKTDRDVVVNTFEELFHRVMRFADHREQPISESHNSMKLKLKLKAKALKAKLLLSNQRNHTNQKNHSSDNQINHSSDLGMPYIPASQVCNSLDVDTPDSMGYEIHQALKKLKVVVGNVEVYVQKKLGFSSQTELCKSLSAEQSDAVALAIYNIEQRGQALIVGDQTGIGKGRIAAAMVRYGRQQGMHPIFITEKPNLFSDLYRDLKAIGSESLKPYIVNARDSKTHVKDEDGNVVYEALGADAQKKIIDSGNLPKEFDYVMLTYSQISGGEINKRGEIVGKSPKGSWVQHIAKGNIIVMDEAHNASGESNTGKILQDIIRETKGVTFLSATFAKRPDNMPIYAMKTAMSEANMSKNALVEGIERGGVALQEVLSAQLVQHGQMIRRERSFEGIEVNYITLDEKAAEHKAISDNITQIVRDIIAFQKDFIDIEVDSLDKIAAKTNTGSNIEKRKGTKGAGVDSTPYFSKVFQVVNQMLFAIKADAVAERAIQRLKEGKKPVIAFSSTMGSFIESLTDVDGQSKNEDGTKINADFATVLQKGLDGVLRYTERDETGKSVHKKFEITDLSEEAQTEYKKIAAKIRSVSSGIVISPIDLVKKKLVDAGYRVAEVTGRKLEVELKLGKEKNIGLIKTRKREFANDAFRKFQNNEVDVLMINQSGSTGASAHALPTKNVPREQVKQRVMLLLQAELDINTEVQKRGRINSTGQIYKPIYDYVFSAIPAEKRLMMMLQKKLKSLDANTTSNQKQSEAVLSVDDFLNKIGDRVVTTYLKDNPTINTLLDDPLGLSESSADNGNNTVMEDAAHRVSGRVAVLPTDTQEKFYSAILKMYREEVEYLKQIDEYDLEVDVLDLKAATLDKSIKIVGKGGQSAFGDNTYIEKCEVNILKKPYSVNELENLYVQSLENKTPTQIKEALVNKFGLTTQSNLNALLKEIKDDYKLRIENIADEKGYKALHSETERKSFLEIRGRELEKAREEKLTKEIAKSNNRSQAMLDIFSFFTIGRKLFYPLDMENESSAKSLAVCLGVRVDPNNEKPFLPSNMKLQVAIASGKKRIDIPLSKIKDINAIMGVSASLPHINFEQLKDEWQSAIKSVTKDRGVAYIVTGNLLQSYGDDSFNKGRLISYTTHDGRTMKGRLMPDGWEPSETKQGENLIKVPIIKALKIIAGLVGGNSITTEDGATLTKTYDNNFKLMVSASRSGGGDVYLDQELNALMDNGRFDKTSNYMVATFPSKRLEKVVQLFQQKHNASVSVLPYQLDMIINEVEADRGFEQISDKVKMEVAEKIEERKTEIVKLEPEPSPSPSERDGVRSANVLRLRLALKAKALKVKLKMAA